MYTMIDCRSDQRSSTDASLSKGSRAFLDSDGVMMIEKGHVAMVASGSMSSLATIESPDEADNMTVQVQECARREKRCECVCGTFSGSSHSPDDEYRTPG